MVEMPVLDIDHDILPIRHLRQQVEVAAQESELSLAGGRQGLGLVRDRPVATEAVEGIGGGGGLHRIGVAHLVVHPHSAERGDDLAKQVTAGALVRKQDRGLGHAGADQYYRTPAPEEA